jgi:hypothetical protein
MLKKPLQWVSLLKEATKLANDYLDIQQGAKTPTPTDPAVQEDKNSDYDLVGQPQKQGKTKRRRFLRIPRPM